MATSTCKSQNLGRNRLWKVIFLLPLAAFSSCNQSVQQKNLRGKAATLLDCTLNPNQGACKEASDKATGLGIHGPDTALSGSAILISWDRVPEAATYNLIISKNASCIDPDFEFKGIEELSQAITFSKDGTYYLCTKAYGNSGALIPGEVAPHKVSVADVNGKGLIGASNLVAAIDKEASAGVDTDGVLWFLWVAGQDKVNGIRDYTLRYYNKANCDGLETKVVKITDTFFELRGAVSGESYSFTLETFNTLGASVVSECSSSVTANPQAVADALPPSPGASGLLLAANVSATTLDLNWQKASDIVSSEGDISYLIYISSLNNITTVDLAESNGTAIGSSAKNISSQTVSGLTPNTTYYFNVIAEDAAGNRAAYTAISKTTLADLVGPTADAFLPSTGVTASGFTLNWLPAYDAITTVNQLSYFVCSGATAAAVNSIAKCAAATQEMPWTANTTSLAISGKAPLTTYYYNVIVKDGAGNQSLLNGKTQATGSDTTAPTAGSFAAATGITPVAFNLNWSQASDGMTPVASLEYFVCSGVNSTAIDTAAECLAATQEMAWTANATSLAITGKSPATTYYYNVVVRDAAGNQAIYNGTSQATDADVTAPNAATIAASTGVSETAFNLVWSPASDNATTAAALQYFVCSGANAPAIDTAAECLAATQEMGWTANTTSLAITGKSPATTYYYNVVVRDTAGNQAVYPGLTQATIADVVVPSAGSFAASTGVSDAAFNLVWSAASDNVTTAASLEYFVCSGANTSAIDTAAECLAATQEMSWTANTTGLAITGKTPATSYYYNVVVRDGAGNQSIYNGRTQATTNDSVVPTPGAFAASTSVSDGGFILNWTAGSDNATAAADLQYFVCSAANSAAIDTAAECTSATQELPWTANTTSLAITGKTPTTTYY